MASYTAQSSASASGGTEEAGAQPISSGTGEKTQAGGLSFLSAGRQNFSLDDFKNPQSAPIIARFLINALDRLETEKDEMRCEVQALRNSSDERLKQIGADKVEIATLRGKLRGMNVNEILFFICSSSGAAGFPIMLAVDAFPGGRVYGFYGMIVSGILLVGSILLRAWAIFG